MKYSGRKSSRKHMQIEKRAANTVCIILPLSSMGLFVDLVTDYKPVLRPLSKG